MSRRASCRLLPASGAEPTLIRQLTGRRSGGVVDVARPCNSGLRRRIASGRFQPIDMARLSEWPDAMLWSIGIDGIIVADRQPRLVPFGGAKTACLPIEHRATDDSFERIAAEMPAQRPRVRVHAGGTGMPARAWEVRMSETVGLIEAGP